MASEVEKSISAILLNGKSYGRWNYAELETDCPELVNSVRCRLEEANPSHCRREDVQGMRVPRTWHKLTDVGVKRPGHGIEVSPIPLPGFLKVKGNYLERKPLTETRDCRTEAWCQAGGRQFGEQIGSTRDSLQDHGHPSLFIKHTVDDMDYSKMQASFPPYSSNLKNPYSKSMHNSEALTRRFSRCSLSVPPPKISSSEPEKTRSRSLSAARCPTSSGSLSPPCLYSQANIVGDPISTYQLLQQRIDDDVEMSYHGKKSSFQTNYWACALPDFSPPSPDRQSPYWNPNEEYQDLLDYTYPLNARHLRSKKTTRSNEVSDLFLHDSGIDLDSLSVSPESTVKSGGVPFMDKHPAVSNTSLNSKYMSPPQTFSTPLCKKPGSSRSTSDHQRASTGKVSLGEYSSLLDKVDLSTDSMSNLPLAEGPLSSSYQSDYVVERGWCSTGDSFAEHKLKKPRHGILPTTQVLPLKQDWDSDDEYLSLPESLKELETLAGQLMNISITVRNPGIDDAEEDRSHCLSSKGHLSFEYVEDHEGKESHKKNRGDTGEMVDYCALGHEAYVEGIKMGLEQGASGSRLKTVSSLRDMVDGMSYSDCTEFEGQHLCTRRDQKYESLVQCIKIFCHKLEELIEWLYKVAEVKDNWIPPKPEVESIKSSLELYLKFKKDIAKHQTLTTSVLKIGEILLKCMSSNSPVLRDALGMIAKQSEELERQADQLYASVIAAMDTISGDSKPLARKLNPA
ncbi:centrosomal protein of 68 kDa [Rhinatrema bivittatum]|uniref:centrosomal protein of 68 kDa n=1 Tax=Rhinatrema bivittatum TaxID=194408 RepID=UPI00112A7062|nr:centrosomal protein of 68 kDa [Rhinatrema bivittatum]